MGSTDSANDPNKGSTDKDEPLPNVIQKVDKKQLQQFVTAIKTAEQQVGENIIRALSHDDTVAVLTTVVMSPNGQQIVSAALNPTMMQQVQQMLLAAQHERKEEEQCMGFHCFIDPVNPETNPEKGENESPAPL